MGVSIDAVFPITLDHQGRPAIHASNNIVLACLALGPFNDDLEISGEVVRESEEEKHDEDE